MILNIGDKILIIDAGSGARGINGKEGIVTIEPSNNGLYRLDKGFNVKLESGAIWRCSLAGKYKVIKKRPVSIKITTHDDITKATVKFGENKTRIAYAQKTAGDDYNFQIGAIIATMRGLDMDKQVVNRVIDALYDDGKKNPLDALTTKELLDELCKRMK